jgi:hypothetical protein
LFGHNLLHLHISFYTDFCIFSFYQSTAYVNFSMIFYRNYKSFFWNKLTSFWSIEWFTGVNHGLGKFLISVIKFKRGGCLNIAGIFPTSGFVSNKDNELKLNIGKNMWWWHKSDHYASQKIRRLPPEQEEPILNRGNHSILQCIVEKAIPRFTLSVFLLWDMRKLRNGLVFLTGNFVPSH